MTSCVLIFLLANLVCFWSKIYFINMHSVRWCKIWPLDLKPAKLRKYVYLNWENMFMFIWSYFVYRYSRPQNSSFWAKVTFKDWVHESTRQGCYMPSRRFPWNFASLKGLPQNWKRQTGLCFGSFRGEIAHPPGFIGLLPWKLLPIWQNIWSSQYNCIWPIALRVYTHIERSLVNTRKKCQSVWLTACQSTKANKWVRCETFWKIPIFDDFKVKYLPLPESLNNNFYVSLWSIVSSLNNIKNIFGHSHFFGSDATYKQQIKHISFNFNCHTILAILDHSGRQTEMFKLPTRETHQGGSEIIKPSDILRKRQRFTLQRDACHQNIDSKLAMFLFSFCCFTDLVLKIS